MAALPVVWFMQLRAKDEAQYRAKSSACRSSDSVSNRKHRQIRVQESRGSRRSGAAAAAAAAAAARAGAEGAGVAAHGRPPRRAGRPNTIAPLLLQRHQMQLRRHIMLLAGLVIVQRRTAVRLHIVRGDLAQEHRRVAVVFLGVLQEVMLRHLAKEMPQSDSRSEYIEAVFSSWTILRSSWTLAQIRSGKGGREMARVRTF